MKLRLLLLLLVGMLSLPLTVSGQLLSTANMRQALIDLPERKLSATDQQAAQQALEQTLVWLEVVERTEDAQQQLEKQLAGAPQQIAEAQKALQRLLTTPQKE